MKIGDELQLKKDFTLANQTVLKKGEIMTITDILPMNEGLVYRFQKDKTSLFRNFDEMQEIFIMRKDKLKNFV